MTRRRHATEAQVKRVADMARALGVRALELGPDGSIRVELPETGGDTWERMAKAARG